MRRKNKLDITTDVVIFQNQEDFTEMSMMTKTFEQAIEACGGKDAAHKVLDRYLKAVATAKVKATETKLLVDWALKQQNRPATQVVG